MSLGRSFQSISLCTLLALSTGVLPGLAENTPAQTKKITILMLNDVYQGAPVDRGQRGGLARVATLKQKIESSQPNTLFLLAGDTISPSIESKTFKGKQMIDAWNALGIDYATLGNHEFDFGPQTLKERIADSKFKWISANVVDKTTGKPFDNIDRYVIRDVDGVKVGIFGLLTKDTLKSSNVGTDVDILDPCETAKSVVKEMRQHGAQVVIALTHLTMTNDKQVAHCAPIDVIVGGHEHVVLQAVSNGTPIMKAASDAVNLGRIDINYSPQKHKVDNIDLQLIPVNSKIPDEPHVAEVVNAYEAKLGKELDQPIGETTVPLDALQADNETQETNLGDYIADAYRADNGAEIGFLNGGSIRSNMIYPPGKLTRRDILSMLPFENPIVKIEVTGKTVREALEHGVSGIGVKSGGRFPQVSGLTFSFNAKNPIGSRIVEAKVNGEPLEDSKTYTLTTNGYVTGGGDGYTMFKDAKYLLSPEDGNAESVALLNAIQKQKSIAPATEGRSKRLDTQ